MHQTLPYLNLGTRGNISEIFFFSCLGLIFKWRFFEICKFKELNSQLDFSTESSKVSTKIFSHNIRYNFLGKSENAQGHIFVDQNIYI